MRRVVGASVLPFSIDPQNQGIYIWLAQERHCGAWAGSLTWSDFGGAIDAVDEGIAAKCAAREFHEESMAILPMTDDEATADMFHEGARQDTAAVERMLAAGEWVFRVNMVVSEGHEYVTFVKQIPWCPAIQQSFCRVRRAALQSTLPPSHACITDGRVDDRFLEKARLRLFSVPQLRRMLRRHHGCDRLRWGFHRRLEVILDQFPFDGDPTCVRQDAGAKIGVGTYQNVCCSHGNSGRTIDCVAPAGGTRSEHPVAARSVAPAGVLHVRS